MFEVSNERKIELLLGREDKTKKNILNSRKIKCVIRV